MKRSKGAKKAWKEFRGTLGVIASKRLFRVLVPVSILFLILSAAVPYFYLYPEAGEQIAIPLHYNIHFGVDLFGPPERMFMASTVGLIVFVVNMILAIALWRKQTILSYGLLCATAVIEVVLFVASVFVTLLVLSYL